MTLESNSFCIFSISFQWILLNYRKKGIESNEIKMILKIWIVSGLTYHSLGINKQNEQSEIVQNIYRKHDLFHIYFRFG